MSKRNAEILLAIISMTWGMAYLLMKLGVETIGPFNLIALRFGIAFLITAALFWKKLKEINTKLIGYSALLGVLIFMVFTTVMFGLESTTASEAGFLCSTTVVFIPLLRCAITQKRPGRSVVISVVVSFTGIGLLTLGSTINLNLGSFLCLLSALLYAIYMVVTHFLTQKENPLLIGIFQLGFAAFLGLLFSLLFEQPSLPHTDQEWVAVLGLAFICSAFGFVMQPVAQKYTTPERAGILYSLEPVSAALLGFLFLQEVLPVRGYIGATMILISCFIQDLTIDA
ncbi:hypothetical protein SRRS_06370 [Sporomusa rhizae]|uniref:DMT family transporter n=1 Tax=Sporomusa rhizae TaxID=357999 RepID=UPI00352AD751